MSTCKADVLKRVNNIEITIREFQRCLSVDPLFNLLETGDYYEIVHTFVRYTLTSIHN